MPIPYIYSMNIAIFPLLFVSSGTDHTVGPLYFSAYELSPRHVMTEGQNFLIDVASALLSSEVHLACRSFSTNSSRRGSLNNFVKEVWANDFQKHLYKTGSN